MVKVRAHSNIALIKYWGKRNEKLKLPVHNSLSMTLDRLYTETQLQFDTGLRSDRLILNGAEAPEAMQQRVQAYLDRLRALYPDASPDAAEIHSHNAFPTGAGLASSASAFAALAAAWTQAAGLQLSKQEISRLARLGSGSACRSVFGGFVEWQAGQREDGGDSFAVPLELEWPLQLLVLVVSAEHKAVGSGRGMRQSVESSPYYPAWVESHGQDLHALKAGLKAQDFEQVGEIMEHNALKMHASAMVARPSVLYWQPSSVALIHHIQALRAQGHSCYFTMDAGPNVKVLLPPESSEHTLQALSEHPAVQKHFLCRPGPGLQVLES